MNIKTSYILTILALCITFAKHVAYNIASIATKRSGYLDMMMLHDVNQKFPNSGITERSERARL